ncbi:hypothetical protein GKC56_04100, partial [Neisseriaceae bacterium PsAf]|nr:hypothetical protein [Neisseriaceae bacterium PsAf]
MNNQVTGYDHNGLPNATRDSVQFRTNPNPKQAYKVKVTVHDAPGDWGVINFFAHYQADNCEYTANRFAWVTGHPERDLEIQYDGFNNNQMQGIVYLDGMLDEDYYGQGECDWKLTSITA